jgi:hypothetical protein
MEYWDLYLKPLLGIDIFHQIGSKHLAQFRLEVATGNVLVLLMGLDNGLNTDDAFPLHFLLFSVAVVYKPMTAKELNGKSIVVLNSYPVVKHKFLLHRIGIIRLVELLYNDIDAFGNLRLHFGDLLKYKNYPQSKIQHIIFVT